MEDFRKNPLYEGTLRATAITWCGLLDSFRFSAAFVGEEAARVVLKRCIGALPQIVQELKDPNRRHERSRWCEIGLAQWQRTGATGQPHVEHPWTKKATLELIEAAVIPALERGVGPRDEALVDWVASILDARCDTVLLSSQKTGKAGIRDAEGGLRLDGFRERYLPAVQSGAIRIWDRLEGREVTADELVAIDEEREKQVKAALAGIDRLGRGLI